MLIKRFLMVLLFAVAVYTPSSAQSGDFCEAVNAVMNDAPNDYRNIRGRMMESNMNSNMWASTIKIPGSIGYRIVQAMGLFYESAVGQSTNKDDLGPIYEEYKKKLNNCLAPKGYKLSSQENFTAGLSDYRKLVWMKEVKEPTRESTTKDLPPHVTMEATYNKDIGKFTIVMFIFQH
jgi:hypothetical protein